MVHTVMVCWVTCGHKFQGEKQGEVIFFFDGFFGHAVRHESCLKVSAISYSASAHRALGYCS
jgi:hypothetical protein